MGHNTIIGTPGGADRVVESGDYNFNLSDGSITATAGGSVQIQDDLTNISSVQLTGGPSGNQFNVSDWSGTANLIGGSGTNTYTVHLNGTGSGTTTIDDTGGDGLGSLVVNGTASSNALGLTAGQVTLSNGEGTEP